VAELAANAVLHTRAPFDVSIAESADTLRIDVIDSSPEQLPVALPSSGAVAVLVEDAVTGRGLRLVSGLGRRWGYTTTTDTKSVWVELGAGARVDGAVVVHGHVTDAPADAVNVDLRDLPVLAAIGSGMQVEGLIRELQLGFFDASTGTGERARLLALLDRSAPARLAGRHAAVAAAANGRDRFDLKMALSSELMDAFAALSELLIELPARVPESFASPDDAVIAFRAWLQDEVVAQLRGGAPRQCPLEA
jgi:hypothetical protein